MAEKEHRTTIGGQAVIEGVMMRGVKSTAMAVRKPDGDIDLEVWQNTSIRDKHKLLRIPVVRGVVSFVEMLIYGYKTLMASADIAGFGDEDEKPQDGEEKKEKKPSAGEKVMEGGSMLLGVLVAILLFSVAPMLLVKYTDPHFHYGVFKTIVEGIVRIIIFVAYLFAVSRMKDIQRVFEYHGAEHKTIHCYEHLEELTPENAKRFSRLHPRCGTSFLLVVLVVSILVFSLAFVTWNNLLLRIIIKLVLLPVIVGISFEIIKFAGRHDNNILLRIILAPGMWLQKLTTREPDLSQLEVAIASLKAVLTDNREEDKW